MKNLDKIDKEQTNSNPRDEYKKFLNKNANETTRENIIDYIKDQFEFELGFRCPSFVICIDIRNSTKLMTIAALSESNDNFTEFIADLIEKFRKIIIDSDGIFDKFTGDGILCHFPILKENKEEIQENVIFIFEEFNNIFITEYQKRLKQKLFPIELKDTGIGIGCDYGEVDYKLLNGVFYAVGLPVVYACRLSCAPPQHVYLNVRAYQEIKSKNFIKTPLTIKNEGDVYVYSRSYSYEK